MADQSIASGLNQPRTVRELAHSVGGAVEGDDNALIHGVASIDDAEYGDIVFAENDRFLLQAQKSRASAIVAFLEATIPDKPLIKVENPRYAFAKILELYKPELHIRPGVDPTAIVGENVHLGEDVRIGAYTVIGDDVRLGDGCRIYPGCKIGPGCEFGDNCVLFSNVSVYHGCTLGSRVILHSGVVIGADGFGYMRIGGESIKVPQIGSVEIGDDVEIGANSTIDRAKTGATSIGARTKIDNLVQIAHNVKVGPDCIIAAQTGVAGSVEIGSGVLIAGQAGIKDHVKIGDGAIVMAQAGLFGDVPPGEVFSGYPARQHREKLKQDACVARLPDYIKRIRELERQNSELHERSDQMDRLMALIAERIGLADKD